ncbi:MAG TPA: phosphatidate cytidylyltransferase [Actinomycetota bacterium]
MNEPAAVFDPDAPDPGDDPGDARASRGFPDARTVAFSLMFAGVAATALILSPVTLFALMLALCIASAGELYRSVRRAGARPIPLAGFAAIGGVFALAYHGPDALLGGIPAVAAAVAGVSLVAMIALRRVDGALAGAASTVAVALVVGVLGSFVVTIRQVESGFRVALTFALMVAAGDVAASLAGRRFGSRPLAPSIGPDKTWGGLAGGTAGVMIAAAVAGASIQAPITMSRAMMLGVLVAVALPLGDLSGAMIVRDGPPPRSAGFFGRGGVLDRIDGLLFAAPIFYFAYRAMVR